jgi:DNA-binding NarL/FixJ family response regulator
MQVLKALIADNHPIFLKGLEDVLSHLENIHVEIVGTATNGKQLLQQLQAFHPSVQLVILDLNLSERDGLEVLKQIRQHNMDVRVIFLTMYDNPKFIRTAFKYGADGYVLKHNNIQELGKGIIDVCLHGKTFMGGGVFLNNTRMATKAPVGNLKYRNADGFVKRHSLTKRELEILHLITQALSNKEIGKTLFISDQTVSVHRKNIMRKLGVSNTAGLIKAAYDHSLV